MTRASELERRHSLRPWLSTNTSKARRARNTQSTLSPDGTWRCQQRSAPSPDRRPSTAILAFSWALEQFGPIEGRDILELGPLEASHTYMLEQRKPASILAIEANRLSFLRCLVVKELLGLKIARFALGNFAPWLETAEQRFDLIVASGVLYHMADPVRLLELLSLRADSLYLWTHYASDEAMPLDDPRHMAFVGETEVRESHGVAVRCHRRSYWGAWKSKTFCGGLYDLHRWIERDDLIQLLRALGFDDIRIAHDEPNHPNGPAFSVFGHRSGS